MRTARALGIGIACLQLALWSGCTSDSEGDAPNAGAGGALAGSGGAGGLVGGSGGLLGGSGGVGGAAGMVVSGMSGSGGAGGVFAGAGSGGVGGVGGFGAVGGDGEAGASGGSGVGGTGGATGMGSMGCGNASPPADGMQTIDVDGTEREFIVAVPEGYDASTPHKLVFAWHGLGGRATQIATGFGGGGFYGLENRAMGSTIFVAGQGLDTSNAVGSGPGWDNMGGRDVAFTAAMLEWLRSSYCIDDDRIFSVGMSYGGIMSNTVGCALGDDFRAIAPIAGMGPSAFGGGGACTGQVAAWIAHGNMDNVVQFSSGEGSRDHWVEANHCDSTSMPSGDNCVAYDGCDDGMPVVWCEFDGGHTVPGFASEEIWAFFSQF
jgi:poly(3-hydroxybutyrate) depolymerase